MITAVNVWSFLLQPYRRFDTGGETLVLHWLLRLAVLACFVGHGAFGIITKAEWLPFFHVVGIPDNIAYALMPVVGISDILVGIVVFFYPNRLFLVYATFWCVWTALLRPLSGASSFEVLERAGNYGIPLALLLATTTTAIGARAWLAKLHPKPLHPRLTRILVITLMLTTSLLLIGHGGFGAFVVKHQLQQHYASVGLGGEQGLWLVKLIGIFEIAMGIMVLLYPARWLLVFIVIWKLFTELLYPVSGSLIFETIERGGSYAAPLALLILFSWMDRNLVSTDTQNKVVADEPHSATTVGAIT